jgi:hypothetical protein
MNQPDAASELEAPLLARTASPLAQILSVQGANYFSV